MFTTDRIISSAVDEEKCYLFVPVTTKAGLLKSSHSSLLAAEIWHDWKFYGDAFRLQPTNDSVINKYTQGINLTLNGYQ